MIGDGFKNCELEIPGKITTRFEPRGRTNYVWLDISQVRKLKIKLDAILYDYDASAKVKSLAEEMQEQGYEWG